MIRMLLLIVLAMLPAGLLLAAGEESTQEQWGEAVEGIRASARSPSGAFAFDESPAFTSAIRNDGKIPDLMIYRTGQMCEIELDGEWYHWVGDLDVKASDFSPGKSYSDIPIRIEPGWSLVSGSGRLSLSPGKHTLRVAFLPESLQAVEKPIRVISNRVEFQILREGEKAPTPKAPERAKILYRGLDLSSAAVTTRVAQLSDVWEERPAGSKSYYVRREVVVSKTVEGGQVFYVPGKKMFFVQYDGPGASVLHYYGPFEGDPFEKLKVERPR